MYLRSPVQMTTQPLLSKLSRLPFTWGFQICLQKRCLKAQTFFFPIRSPHFPFLLHIVLKPALLCHALPRLQCFLVLLRKKSNFAHSSRLPCFPRSLLFAIRFWILIRHSAMFFLGSRCLWCCQWFIVFRVMKNFLTSSLSHHLDPSSAY